jgi:hypothetical protein
MKYPKGYRYWLLLCLCGVIVGIIFYFHIRNGRWAKFEQIKPGMTKAEVKDLMGETEINFWEGEGWERKAGLFSDQYLMEVRFDDQGRVIQKVYHAGEPSYFRRFRNWLGW